MTDHIGEANEMISMTTQRFKEIESRCHNYGEAFKDYKTADQLTMGFNIARIYTQLKNDGYDPAFVELASHSISDIPALLGEVKRLTSELNEALAYIYGDGEEK
jgi:hypothetical protein